MAEAKAATDQKTFLEWARQIEKQNQYIVHAREIFEASVVAESDLQKKQDALAAADKALEDQKAAHQQTIDGLRAAAETHAANLQADYQRKLQSANEDIASLEQRKQQLSAELNKLAPLLEKAKLDYAEVNDTLQGALNTGQNQIRAELIKYQAAADQQKAAMEQELAALRAAISTLRGSIEQLPIVDANA